MQNKIQKELDTKLPVQKKKTSSNVPSSNYGRATRPGKYTPAVEYACAHV